MYRIVAKITSENPEVMFQGLLKASEHPLDKTEAWLGGGGAEVSRQGHSRGGPPPKDFHPRSFDPHDFPKATLVP